MTSKVFFALICLAASAACSDGGHVRSDAKDGDLSARIWRAMHSAESSEGVYQEELNPDLRTRHDEAMSFIRAKIPRDYPEPYLPFGQLSRKDLDPGINREPKLNAEIVALGEALFSEPLLSYSSAHGFSKENGLACAGCHVASQEFVDGRSLSPGIDGDLTHRHTPTLWNAAYYSTLTWFNPNFPILEMQAKIPLFNDDPIEMGLRGKEKSVLNELAKEPRYVSLVKAAFALDLTTGVQNGSVDYTLLTSALAAYERTLIRFDSRFDLFLQGKGRLTAEEKLGASLFYGLTTLRSGERLGCASCHQGFLMSDSFQYVRNGRFYSRSVFHEEIRTPGLRFVAKTAPYFHDGSLSSLDELLDFYEAGKRKGPEQPPFSLIESERAALKDFLETL